MSTSTSTSLPYEEPAIPTILIQSSFLFALNIVNYLFNKLIYCGLVGQIFIGIAWGSPGAAWLDRSVETVVVQLGYLGLILLVYEGGLNTDFKSLKRNLVLSLKVAFTGISVPIALSFVLQALSDATALQAFAAGAALCSTSLGTTSTILSASGLSTTRLGTVLISAAMMDDVVGLVMVQVISNLGQASSGFSATLIARPVAVSIGLVVLVMILCLFSKHLTISLNRKRVSNPTGIVQRVCQSIYTPFLIHTALLLGLVTVASYAGTSNLFAAYLVGASISWWDSEVMHYCSMNNAGTGQSQPGHQSTGEEQENTQPTSTATPAGATIADQNPQPIAKLQNVSTPRQVSQSAKHTTGVVVYQKYYGAAVERILKPFFFASIGFAVPISELFSGIIVWRGIVFMLLMLLAKAVTGLWLVRFNITVPSVTRLRPLRAIVPTSCARLFISSAKKSTKASETGENSLGVTQNRGIFTTKTAGQVSRGAIQPTQSASARVSPVKNPLSLYPGLMLGTAMTARGEIGFLIASLAETNGIFRSENDSPRASSQIYLIVVWAILLCTIIGPLCVGTLVKRVRKLQGKRASNPSEPDPLGIWGVN